ncbi:unnamed protein product, partial [Rotaria sp. Silwood2]
SFLFLFFIKNAFDELERFNFGSAVERCKRFANDDDGCSDEPAGVYCIQHEYNSDQKRKLDMEYMW